MVIVDIENEVFSIVAAVLRDKYDGILVLGETVLAPAEFPCVSIEEADNYANRNTQDTGSNENHANLMYEVNVYTNRASGKKSECKAIFNTVDEIFSSIGFTRIMKKPVSMDDSTKYRMIGRYTAVASKEKVVYRR